MLLERAPLLGVEFLLRPAVGTSTASGVASTVTIITRDMSAPSIRCPARLYLAD